MSDHDPSYWDKLAALLHRSAGKTPVFVDAGANRGDFTAQLLREFPGCTVHAVEPDPQLAAALSQRFAGSSVRVWNVALHEREGTIDLHVHANPGTSSVLRRPAGARRYFARDDRVVATVPVRSMTLDRLAADAAIAQIDFLKLDTQGSEAAILRGAQRLLSTSAIGVIYTEFFLVPHYEGAPLLHELWAALDAHGYTMYDMFKGPYGRNGQLRFGDAIFASPSIRNCELDAFADEE